MDIKSKIKNITVAALVIGLPMNAWALKKNAKKPAAQEFAGYLFAYFEGSGDKQEHLRFAISTSGGIRDPHILRGEDGCY